MNQIIVNISVLFSKLLPVTVLVDLSSLCLAESVEVFILKLLMSELTLSEKFNQVYLKTVQRIPPLLLITLVITSVMLLV